MIKAQLASEFANRHYGNVHSEALTRKVVIRRPQADDRLQK